MRWHVLSLPHGNTITPDLALPLPNILRRLFSWYGLNIVVGFRSILKHNEFEVSVGNKKANSITIYVLHLYMCDIVGIFMDNYIWLSYKN